MASASLACLTEEPTTAFKRVYLVTFPHPQQERASDGSVLKAPGQFTREEMRHMFLRAVDATSSTRAEPLLMKYVGVFLERHADGNVGNSVVGIEFHGHA
jgi:hypothetical protein